jgi:hypothetical protein
MCCWQDALLSLQQEGRAMAANKNFTPDIQTSANFLQARTALDEQKEVVILDFEMLDFEPSPTTVGMKCSVNNVGEIIHTCLIALESLGDQQAMALLQLLNQSKL